MRGTGYTVVAGDSGPVTIPAQRQAASIQIFGGGNREGAGWSLDRHVPELGTTLGEALLVPTKLYTLPCLALARAGGVHAMSHIIKK